MQRDCRYPQYTFSLFLLLSSSYFSSTEASSGSWLWFYIDGFSFFFYYIIIVYDDDDDDINFSFQSNLSNRFRGRTIYIILQYLLYVFCTLYHYIMII